MTKLTYTTMGELIVYRVTTWDGFYVGTVYPTHRKALNVARKHPVNCCVSPVKVFDGRTDRQNVDRARDMVAHPDCHAGWQLRHADRVLEQLGSDYPVITSPDAF